MGTLYIVATPIGNLEDISLRATKTLSLVDIILCEDTRRTGQLLASLSIPHKKLQSYYDQIEMQQTPEIIAALQDGKNIALVSDAGTPLINDPGFVLVSECRKRKIPVISIPGASALLAALASSGLPADKFMFLGYPPEKQGHRIKRFGDLLSIHRCIDSTFVMYCSPHKLQSALADMQDIFGDIEISVSRELTKIHEEYWRGKISDAISYFTEPKGEFVVLFRLK
jgi:16S rRNA (cytidine1402-2'-O)-methyltransferase